MYIYVRERRRKYLLCAFTCTALGVFIQMDDGLAFHSLRDTPPAYQKEISCMIFGTKVLQAIDKLENLN